MGRTLGEEAQVLIHNAGEAHDAVEYPNNCRCGRGFCDGLVPWIQNSLSCSWLESASHRVEEEGPQRPSGLSGR